MMFDNFQAYDVQETRRISREEGRLEGRIEGERAGRIEGERTGRIEGEQLHLIKLVIKKIEKQCSAAQISEILEEPLDTIQQIIDAIQVCRFVSWIHTYCYIVEICIEVGTSDVTKFS